jgi:uncharacterized protein (TIGR03067 family)
MNATLLLATALGMSAPALKDRSPAPVPNVVGIWEIESVTVGGRLLPPFTRGPRSYEFTTGGEWNIRQGDCLIPGAQRGYRVDASAHPATIDLLVNGPVQVGTIYQGICKVERDVLTICYALDKADRPTRFESPAGSEVRLVIFRRLKKD